MPQPIKSEGRIEAGAQAASAVAVGISDGLGELPIYRSNSTLEDVKAKRAIIAEQIKHLVTAPREAQIWVTCPCGQRAVVWQLYRCLYCGVFYCKTCAEKHFGYRKPTLDEDSPNVCMSEGADKR